LIFFYALSENKEMIIIRIVIHSFCFHSGEIISGVHICFLTAYQLNRCFMQRFMRYGRPLMRI